MVLEKLNLLMLVLANGSIFAVFFITVDPLDNDILYNAKWNSILLSQYQQINEDISMFFTSFYLIISEMYAVHINNICLTEVVLIKYEQQIFHEII